MGLFTNSDTERKKNQILSDIAIINKSLRDIANLIDSSGMNMFTINSVGTILENVEGNVSRVSSTVQGMNDSQLSNFNAPWIDGRYIHIMMWINSFVMVTNKISNDMENYVNRR